MQRRRRVEDVVGCPGTIPVARMQLGSGEITQQQANNPSLPSTSSEAQPAYAPQQNAVGACVNRNNDNRLRDELIALLMRRDQLNQPRAYGEDRRPHKTIHNWPFRYKGEKDASSLNTFLQRVEIFAMSEELSEETLLKNIKHLLLDDALTWYGNAYLSGQLGSWERFKILIRREFLPASYAFAIRVEAYHRLQGENEPFSKFLQDISTLFHHSDPPMSELEKLFIIKKNMNSTYAPIVAAQQSSSMMKLVQGLQGV